MNAILKDILINCGFAPEFIIRKKLKISSKKISEYIQSNKLIVTKHMLFGKVVNIYTLSEKSIRKLKHEGYSIYKHDTSQLEHDYFLLKTYLSLKKIEQASWQNETVLKKKFGKDFPTTDALYIKNNKLIGVEIITANYKKEKIEQKKNFISKYCDSSIIINANELQWRK